MITLEDLLRTELSAEDRAIAEKILNGEDEHIEVPDLLLEEVVGTEADVQVQKGLAQQIKDMIMSQKLKLALKGGREARGILIRDSNRIVKRMVFQNPRITEDELVMFAKNKSEDREFIEMIGKNPEWNQSYAIRLALAQNPKTPVPAALRFTASLGIRDLRMMAKSKNVPNPVSSLAKKIVVTKTGGGGSSGGGH